MFENIKKLLDKSESVGIPAMDVVVYHKGKEVFREIRGVMDEDGSPLTKNTLFDIYSCSKFITCAAALTLLDEGKISLEDDVADYIPAFGDMKVKKNGGIFKAEKRIKLFHLFTMTSGLSYDVGSEHIERAIAETEGRCPTVETMNYIAKMPLEFEPGENWRYSLSHDVLAAIVEIVSGKRFGEYVSDKIFKPLEMKNTTYNLSDKYLPCVCMQYRYDAQTKKYNNIGKTINYKFGSEYESGGAGAVSTVDDYIKFLEGVRLGKVISLDTLDRMTTDYLTDTQRPACWVAKGYGYGLGVRVPNATNKRTDFGWNGAAGAYGAVDEKNEITLYYSQAVKASPARPLQSYYIEAAKLDLGFEACVDESWMEIVNPLAGSY